MRAIKILLRRLLERTGYTVFRLPVGERPGEAGLPDSELYQPTIMPPVFSPWLGLPPFADDYASAARLSLVSRERAWVLHSLARQALWIPGDFVECGVYRGGTAALLSQLLSRDAAAAERLLHLFDSFAGMPDTNPERDKHKAGDFADTSVEGVRSKLARPETVRFHPGFIPATFQGLDSLRVAFAHVDVDLHQAVLDCCEFIHPRLTPGGFMVFDDYGFPSCPGARQAVDAFFRERREVPLVLPTGQAVVCKLPD